MSACAAVLCRVVGRLAGAAAQLLFLAAVVVYHFCSVYHRYFWRTEAICPENCVQVT